MPVDLRHDEPRHAEPERPTDGETTLSDEEWPVSDLYRVEPPAETPTDAEPEAEPEHEGTVVLPGTQVAGQQGPPAPPPTRRFPPDLGPGLLLALLAAVLLIPAAAWLATRGGDDPAAATEPLVTTDTTLGTTEEQPEAPAPPGPTVPTLVGLTLEDARALLEKADLDARVRRAESAEPPGEVLEQSPAPGSAPSGRFVVLTVSEGEEELAVPDVEGLQVTAAAEKIRNAGLQPEIRTVRSTEKAGTVVDQVPESGTKAEAQSVVRLEVATPPPRKEPATVELPNLVGVTAAEARRSLRSLGLRWSIAQVESEQPQGVVVGQSPRAGAEVREGRRVQLRVSKGPATATVPDVRGLGEQTARERLESAGFTVEVLDMPTEDPGEDGLVVDQAPAARETAREGTTVTITVARFA